MKVYVITRGSYSDYHICAVATDPEQAEKLAKIYSDRCDPAEVEEYDTENHRGWCEGRVPFEVIFFRDGAPLVWLSSDELVPKIEAPQARGSVELVIHLYAPDRDTALKIAYDKRAEYLAQKAGI